MALLYIIFQIIFHAVWINVVSGRYAVVLLVLGYPGFCEEAMICGEEAVQAEDSLLSDLGFD